MAQEEALMRDYLRAEAALREEAAAAKELRPKEQPKKVSVSKIKSQISMKSRGRAKVQRLAI